MDICLTCFLVCLSDLIMKNWSHKHQRDKHNAELWICQKDQLLLGIHCALLDNGDSNVLSIESGPYSILFIEYPNPVSSVSTTSFQKIGIYAEDNNGDGNNAWMRQICPLHRCIAIKLENYGSLWSLLLLIIDASNETSNSKTWKTVAPLTPNKRGHFGLVRSVTWATYIYIPRWQYAAIQLAKDLPHVSCP